MNRCWRPSLVALATLAVLAALAALAALLGPPPPLLAGPVGTAFTYQGQLRDSGVVATGAYDFAFTLYDAPTGGALIGAVVSHVDVPVTGGLFVVSLDFGADAFSGSARFLEIAARPGASIRSFTQLAERQELTPSPNAIFATQAADAKTIAGLACSDGQVVKWSGVSWVCGEDAGVGSVSASSGLTGGTITTRGGRWIRHRR